MKSRATDSARFSILLFFKGPEKYSIFLISPKLGEALLATLFISGIFFRHIETLLKSRGNVCKGVANLKFFANSSRTRTRTYTHFFIRTSTLLEKATLRTEMFYTLLKRLFWFLNSTSSSPGNLDILKQAK